MKGEVKGKKDKQKYTHSTSIRFTCCMLLDYGGNIGRTCVLNWSVNLF